MALNNSLTLDEIVHNRPEVVQWWVQEMGGQPMDENLIYRYVCESPFFDWTTKNGLLFQQAQANMDQWQITLRRQSVEDFLRARPGTEYMIVGEPQLVADKAQADQGVKTGVWVIRKQLRERLKETFAIRPPGVVVENGWELTTLATYFLVGENMYQAPSVGDVVSNRLLAATSSLNKLINITNRLPRYEPSKGYSYLPSVAKPTTADSISGSPSRSREGSIVPGAESQSIRSGSVLPESQATTSPATDNMKDAHQLREALRMVTLFGDDYLDENPLQGEPGNFSFTSSSTAVRKRRADEEAAAAKALAEKESAATLRTASVKPEKVSTPPAIFTDQKTAKFKTEKDEKSERRGSKMDGKAKRRKSRHPGVTPTTPSSATSTQAPNSAL